MWIGRKLCVPFLQTDRQEFLQTDFYHTSHPPEAKDPIIRLLTESIYWSNQQRWLSWRQRRQYCSKTSSARRAALHTCPNASSHFQSGKATQPTQESPSSCSGSVQDWLVASPALPRPLPGCRLSPALPLFLPPIYFLIAFCSSRVYSVSHLLHVM